MLDRLGDDGGAIIDEAWLREGLEEVRRGWEGGDWCLERRVFDGVEQGKGKGNGRGGKRKRSEEGAGGGMEEEEKRGMVDDRLAIGRASISLHLRSGTSLQEPCLRFSSIGERSWEVAEHRSDPLVLPVEDAIPYGHMSAQEIGNRLISNSSESEYFLKLHVSSDIDGGPPTYKLPPRSSFLLSTIDARSARTFSESAYATLPKRSKSAGPGQFDLVLLDPPWENRSVRRSKKYETMQSRNHNEHMDPLTALTGILGQHIAPEGLVGCWITNKATVQEKAMQLLESWGVEVDEQWVYLKVTSKGEPVTELGGLWRKPYEVLLIGRKVAKGETGERLRATGEREGEVLRRRLIISVHDLHSRKPNLKELFEPILPDPEAYRALEMFARNLTAGWWAWGDECLKYNWTGNWSPN